MINSTEHEIYHANKYCLSKHVDGYFETVDSKSEWLCFKGYLEHTKYFTQII